MKGVHLSPQALPKAKQEMINDQIIKMETLRTLLKAKNSPIQLQYFMMKKAMKLGNITVEISISNLTNISS